MGNQFYISLLVAFLVLLPHNISVDTHEFSLKAYNYDITANNWEGAGDGEVIEDGGMIKPGQIFKVDIYYKAPQTIEQTMMLQTGVKYNPDVVEPIWAPHEEGIEDDVYVETDMTTTAFGGLWPPKGNTAIQKKQTNWTVEFHDDKDTNIIKFLIGDSQLNNPLTTEGALSAIYFKVKDNVPSGTEIDLHVDYDYTKAAGIVPGGLPKTTSGILLKVK